MSMTDSSYSGTYYKYVSGKAGPRSCERPGRHTYIEIEEAKDALVRQDVEGIAIVAVNDGQAVHLVETQGADGVKETGVRIHVNKRLGVVL